MQPIETWWIQTLINAGSLCSPAIMGLHNVDAPSEASAVAQLAEKLGAPAPPAVLPQIEREARARGDSDACILETMKTALRTALGATPKGLVITHIGTDFGEVTGLRASMTPQPESPAQAA